MTITFDSTIGKKTKGGAFVLSSSLEPGETLSTGETYDEVAERLGAGTPVTNVAGVTQEESPVTSDALTLDPTGTSTIREGDTAPEVPEAADVPPNVATVNPEGDSTEVQVGNEKLQANNAEISADAAAQAGNAGSDDEDDEDGEPKVPAFSADKQTLYDFAKAHRGLTEEYTDITKGQIIENYLDKD